MGFGNYGDQLLADIVEKHLGKSCARLSSKDSLYAHYQICKNNSTLIAIGGLFQDRTSLISLIYYSLVISLCRLAGKKIILLAQGIGPLKSILSFELTKFVFGQAHYISLRDSYSATIMDFAGIKYTLGADLAWTYLDTQTEIYSLDFNKALMIIPRNDYLSKVSFDLYLRKYEQIIFLLMQKEDILAAQKISEKFQGKFVILDATEMKLSQILYLMQSSCIKVLSMRYHGAILAKIAGVDLDICNIDTKLEILRQEIGFFEARDLEKKASLLLDELKNLCL